MVVSAPEPHVSLSSLDSQRIAPALDADALAKLIRLDPTGHSGLQKRVLTAYLASLGRLRLELDSVRHEADLGSLSMAVHTLKSSSASVGALRLSGLCATIEQAARHGRLDGLPEQVEGLRREIDRVDQAIQHMIANPAAHA